MRNEELFDNLINHINKGQKIIFHCDNQAVNLGDWYTVSSFPESDTKSHEALYLWLYESLNGFISEYHNLEGEFEFEVNEENGKSELLLVGNFSYDENWDEDEDEDRIHETYFDILNE